MSELCCAVCSVVSKTLQPHRLKPQASLSMGYPREQYWSGLPFPTPGDLPDPEDRTSLSNFLHWHANSPPVLKKME